VGRFKKLPVLERVTIVDIGAEGNAIGRVDDMVVFAPMVIPGDVVDIQLKRKRRKFAEGVVIKIHEYSSDRIKPACVHFGVCGGCKWQHLPYDKQLYYKQKQVKDNLERIGKIDIRELKPIKGSEDAFFYRNKLEFTFSDKRWLTKEEIASDLNFDKMNGVGFHIPGQFDKVLDITECLLQPEPSNQIRNAVREYSLQNKLVFFDLREQTGLLRNLIVRNSTSGGLMVIVIFFHNDTEKRVALLDFIKERFPQVTSLMYSINTKRNDSLGDQEVISYSGEDHIIENIDDLVFRVGPKSFYQTNTKQAVELYRIAKEFAGLTGKEIVYDLYTGTGTIANYVARDSQKVIGVEFVEEAIKDAEINSKLNNIKNTRFFSGDMKSILTDEFISINGSPDVIITDPPRAGMHEDVIKTILKASPERIVYVSCNPATQARDILLLSKNYKTEFIQPVDMFPHTHHVENVVLLIKKEGKG
jgi:23S rRNA (uracil1939-C5)-methyltransferase